MPPNTTDNANTNCDVTLPRAVGVASPVFIAPLIQLPTPVSPSQWCARYDTTYEMLSQTVCAAAEISTQGFCYILMSSFI